MDAIAVIGRARVSRVLIDDPDWRFGLVLTRSPLDDRPVELLDLGVVVAESEGDDLGDLHR
jgi:hypothetical protein